jgi:pseudouridine synthase
VLSDEGDGSGRLTTVLDLVPLEGHLFPVGRLDLRSEGLILLTDDGKLTHRLTHPRYEHEKEYRALVEGQPDEAVLNKWRQGVFLDGRRTAPAEVTVARREKGKTWLHVTWLRVVLREGRKRQIRRTAAMLGHPVHRLIRVRIGSLHLGDLKPGQWRTLSEAEVEALRATVAQPPSKARRTPRKRRAPGTRGKPSRKRRKGGGGKRKY